MMLSFDYAIDLMHRLNLEPDAVVFFTKMADDILGVPQYHADTAEICDLLIQQPDELEPIFSRCDQLAQKTGYHEYSITIFICLAAAEMLHQAFSQRGISDPVFYSTADELRVKLMECWDVYGIHGSFTRGWLFAYFRLQRVSFGRLCFELNTWHNEPILFGTHTIFPGDSFIGIHIPANGKPFDPVARQESYRQALEFFRKDFSGPVIPMVCTSWLLDPVNQSHLSEASNIRNFAEDFDLVIGRKTEAFTNGWRIWGAKATLPVQELPEQSSLQRVYKQRLLAGDTFYNGCAIMWKEVQ